MRLQVGEPAQGGEGVGLVRKAEGRLVAAEAVVAVEQAGCAKAIDAGPEIVGRMAGLDAAHRGGPAPVVAAVVNATGGGATGGSLPAGNYIVTYAWASLIGETTPSPNSIVVTVAAGNTPRVTLAICDPRGKPKSDSIEAVARVLDKSEAMAVQRAVNKRYGIVGWGFGVYMKLRGLDKKSVGVELKAV